MRLYLTEGQLAAIMRHVNTHVPLEACGLLGGLKGVVHRVYQIPNIAMRPEISFRMEPSTQVQAMIEIDKQGMELVGIYHSHPPGSRSEPSETDLRDASYPTALSLIVVPCLDSESTRVRAFMTCNQQAVEVPIVINSKCANSGA